jgi:predicted amidohydrolase
MKDVKLGLINMESRVGDVEHNLATIEYWAREAAAQEVEILLYPEVCVTGYDVTETGPLFPQCIEPVPGPSTARLCALAAKHSMMLIPGILERDPGGAIFNTQLVINADGTLQGKYRKTHPGLTELATFGAGDELPIFHHPKVTFGIQICYDTHFPLPSGLLAEKGAELILCPHASAVEVVDDVSSATDKFDTGEGFAGAPGRSESKEEGAMKLERVLRYIPARAYDNSIFVA